MYRRRSIGRLGRAAIAVPGMMALALGSVLVAPASAQAEVSCGDEITQDTTLTQDLGPCPGHGLVVTADNVTIDLNGHTITGPHGSSVAPAPGEHVGINLMGVSGVTVTGGEVHNFDSGVAMGNSSGNTVQGMNVHHNINHSALGGAINDCNFGDGITLVNSDNNRITGNRVANNGPLSGIALVYDSDGNQLTGNQVQRNDVRAQTPSGEGILCGTGPDQGPMGSGRPVQDIGIRIEGPGANGNRVADNQVVENALFGIAVHPHVCQENPSGSPPAPPNDDNRIQNNTVTGTGTTIPDEEEARATGIVVLANGPADVVCTASNTTIVGNDSNGNDEHGISVEGRGTSDNQVTNNTADGNGVDGIHLSGPSSEQVPGVLDSRVTANSAHGNGGVDAYDGWGNCEHNQWRGNQFGSVNPDCIS